jgi:hypothetical protein
MDLFKVHGAILLFCKYASQAIASRTLVNENEAMARFSFVVYSNPVEGREQEYNDWYTNRHLKDLLAIPGVISARRFKISSTQIREAAQSFQYLAIYDIEADDVQSFIDEIMRRTADGSIARSTAMASDIVPLFWEAL